MTQDTQTPRFDLSRKTLAAWYFDEVLVNEYLMADLDQGMVSRIRERYIEEVVVKAPNFIDQLKDKFEEEAAK